MHYIRHGFYGSASGEIVQSKTFIAISTEVYNSKLVHLATSCGLSLTNENGIDHLEAIEFLFSLIHKRKRSGGVVFVCYGFQRDNEFIFSTMPKALKDKLFRSHVIKRQIDELEFENENILADYFRYNLDSQDFEQADFELHVNKLALDELTEVKVNGYDLALANGKMLTIRKNKKSITIYDIFGFFKPKSLRVAAKVFLDAELPLLDRQLFDTLEFFDGVTDFDKLKNHAALEVDTVARLMAKLNELLTQYDINLSRFHGASAITSHILSKSKARKQYHNYRYKHQLAPPLHHALRQSVYGGRAEQFKIGTLQNIKVYDINSAYAAAATDLPIMLTKPTYYSSWIPEKFSFWQCEYDFTKTGLYFGLLPNRELTSFTKYKLKGSGVFWQPEITYVLKYFPECIKIGGGYALTDTQSADFTEKIKEVFKLRLQLQAEGNPLEAVLKLALSSIYGKFCQHNGKGHYYNLFYAGYITSATRAQLLKATRGNETKIICFQTDAIHSTTRLPLPLSGDLGEYKISEYDKVTYLDNGVYQCTNGGKVVKTKTRGFRRFDFAKALRELVNQRSYTALAEFFVGHNLFSKNLFTSADYLADFATPKTMYPSAKDRLSMRHFMAGDIDLTKDFLDSQPISVYNGLPSAPYSVGSNKSVDLSLDTILAGRI